MQITSVENFPEYINHTAATNFGEKCMEYLHFGY
jgi:hypothetical protein